MITKLLTRLLPEKFLALTFFLLAVVAFPTQSMAVVHSAQGDGDWDTITWAPAGTPGNADQALIGGNFTVSYTSGDTGNLSRLYVGTDTGFPSDNGTMIVSGGTLSLNANAAGTVEIGNAANSTGTINISGGFLEVGTSAESGVQVGDATNAIGNLNVSSGTLTVRKGISLGAGSSATGNMLVSGGVVNTATGTTSAIFYVAGRNTSDTTTGNFEQTGGSVDIDGSDFMGVGFSANSTQNTLGTALITGGTFSGNMRVGRDSGGGGSGSGKLTIGPSADVSGKNQAWDISGTGEIVFKLGVDDTFNAVDLTAATVTEAVLFSEVGATVTIDGDDLVFGTYAPITLIEYASGKGPNGTSLSNVVYDFINFDPGFATPTLTWTDTELQLNLVPEPSVLGLVALASVLGLARRRRRVA